MARSEQRGPFVIAAQLVGHSDDVRAVADTNGAGSPSTLVSASRDRTAKLWSPSSAGQYACAATLEPFALTEDEIEKHFAVNHLVGFKLTALLMKILMMRV